MMIGDRLRAIRVAKNLSQGDIEKRTGLLRCYVSRVENGHTVPAIETLEKMARALGMALYQLLYEAEIRTEPPAGRFDSSMKWGSSGKSARYLHRLADLLARMSARDRNLLMELSGKMAKRRRR
jgi:transcriptional regulator with XRE-family HTH domain